MGDRLEELKRTHRQTILAETFYGLLVAAAIAATWYDCSVPCSEHISVYVNVWVHRIPAVAFLGGALMVLSGWVAHKVWVVKFRYALALLILGFCFGHLFWGQPKP